MTLRSLSRTVRAGFTLIELLLVIGIIAILASIVIVAINPTKQLGSARDAQRHSDVNTIVNAVYQYAIDKNALPSTIPTASTLAKSICKTTAAAADWTGCVNLRMLSGTYIVSVPNDPQIASGTGYTGYMIYSENSRVTVRAPKGEQDSNIYVTR